MMLRGWVVLCLLLVVVGLGAPAEAAQVFADRVRETTATTGTGTVSLLGAETNYRTFNTGISVGNTTYYCIVHRTAVEWECGLGTVATGTTLARTTVVSSSTGSAVSLSAGTKDVFAGVLSSWYSYFPAGAPTDDTVLIGNSARPCSATACRCQSGQCRRSGPRPGRRRTTARARPRRHTSSPR